PMGKHCGDPRLSRPGLAWRHWLNISRKRIHCPGSFLPLAEPWQEGAGSYIMRASVQPSPRGIDSHGVGKLGASVGSVARPVRGWTPCQAVVHTLPGGPVAPSDAAHGIDPECRHL